jgi:hypothetical protein
VQYSAIFPSMNKADRIKGGKARAKKLSAERRKQIARSGAAAQTARWRAFEALATAVEKGDQAGVDAAMIALRESGWRVKD